jgi:hypothetical protein
MLSIATRVSLGMMLTDMYQSVGWIRLELWNWRDISCRSVRVTEVVLGESTFFHVQLIVNHSMALTNIQKTVATILRRYHIEALDKGEELKTHSVGIAEKAGPLLCRLSFRNSD